MTTGNRTNELNQNETKSGQTFCFTEAQVEAAARAIADCHNPGMFEKYPENWRVEARAALVAAQGAAPQAESAPLRDALIKAREHFTAIAGSGEIRVWEDTGEKLGIDSQVRGWAKRAERICLDALAAPVLPSSTVDEGKIEQAAIAGLDAVNPTWRATGTKPSSDDLKFARAVVEAIGGEGR